MKKNVASQIVGCQLISKTDGSAVTTGTTTIYVTGDGGTQAAGSVGSGACTHEGNGYWTYALAQAETNYDQIGFTFVNTAACNVTVQIYPSFPQTGDNYVRLGAPAGASLAADVAAVKVDTAAVKVQTDKMVFTVANQLDVNVLDWKSATAPAMTGDAFARLGAPAGASVSADVAAVKVDTAAIKAKTDNLPADPADASDIAASLMTIAGYIDTEVAAIKAKTDQLTFTVANQVDSNPINRTGFALTSAYDFAKGTVAVTESYAANGVAPTPIQAMLGIHQMLMDFAIAGTNYTVKKLDNTTTAFVCVLNDAVNPTAIART